MAIEHPWRRLRALPAVSLAWRRSPGRLGATNGRDVIVMHPDQSQAQRRCTLAHELAHIELGHVDGCSGSEERTATLLAARWLVGMDQLLDALSLDPPVKLGPWAGPETRMPF